jgi:hypothetical protein
MKAIDKTRFKEFLPLEEKGLGNAVGSAPDDLRCLPDDFVKSKRGGGNARP